MFKGRLGLETARIPYVDRHGLLWLSRGNMVVENGTLVFYAAESPGLKAGKYSIPFQNLSLILLGPGSTVSHDVLRLLARHGTGLVAVGEGGVRMYSLPPWGMNESRYARLQCRMWADQENRLLVARRMYALRLGEVLPSSDISVLRGIEGARMKETYNLLAQKYGIKWRGRRYDRSRPDAADPPNQAINHSATAVEGAAMIAVAATATIPQLGFIHEDASLSFVLDIADLFRDEITLPVAFAAVKEAQKEGETLDRIVRKIASRVFYRKKVISRMIERIKEVLREDDSGGNT